MIFTSNTKLSILPAKKYIFLAGSIDFSTLDNWREQVIDQLHLTHHLFDPTNKNHSGLDQEQMKNHIEWELDALNMADNILLNFLPNARSPISLVELGLYVLTKKLIVICPKEFYQSNYVYTLCNKYNTPIFLDLEEALNTLTLN